MFRAMDRRRSDHKKLQKRAILTNQIIENRKKTVEWEVKTQILKEKSQNEINTLALAATAWAELEELQINDIPFVKVCEGCDLCRGCRECYTVQYNK